MALETAGLGNGKLLLAELEFKTGAVHAAPCKALVCDRYMQCVSHFATLIDIF